MAQELRDVCVAATSRRPLALTHLLQGGACRGLMEQRRITFDSALWLSFGLAACSGGAAEAPASSSGAEAVAPSVAEPTAAAPEPDLAAHMQASFWMAVRARD